MHVEIIDLNESEVLIKCDRGIQQEIHEEFTFQVPGAQFSPKFKAKIWDGKIKLFDLKKKTLTRGLVPDLIEFLKKLNYTYEYNTNTPSQKSLEEIQEKISKLDIPGIEARDYQLESILESLNSRRKIIVSPTGSGKSLLIYILTRLFAAKKILIIVPTIGLVNQMTSDFSDYGLDTDKFVHKVMSGIAKESDKPITISTWQSIFEQSEKYFLQYDAVIGDEAHLFKAKSLNYVMKSLINAKFRIGTTGTLDNLKTNLMVLKGLFGPVYKATSTRELIDRGILSDLNIYCIVLKHTDENKKRLAREKKTKYADEIDYLVSSQARNNFIARLACFIQGNSIVFFQFVEKQGIVLRDKIQDIIDKEKLDRKVYFIDGSISGKEREEIRKSVIKSNNSIIIASFGTSSTGINIPNLDNAIFASPSKSTIRNLQSIGRILRRAKDKDTAKLYDISDDMKYGGLHLEERLKIYAKEKFTFSIKQFQLKG